MDKEKRKKIYWEATELLHEEVPEIFLYQGVDFYGATKRLKNLVPTGDQRLFLYGVALEN